MYNGEKGNSEHIKLTKEFLELLSKFVEYEKELKEKLSANYELSELLIKTSDSMGEMHSELLTMHFEEGFKLGFRMGLEITQE